MHDNLSNRVSNGKFTVVVNSKHVCFTSSWPIVFQFYLGSKRNQQTSNEADRSSIEKTQHELYTIRRQMHITVVLQVDRIIRWCPFKALNML